VRVVTNRLEREVSAPGDARVSGLFHGVPARHPPLFFVRECGLNCDPMFACQRPAFANGLPRWGGGIDCDTNDIAGKSSVGKPRSNRERRPEFNRQDHAKGRRMYVVGADSPTCGNRWWLLKSCTACRLRSGRRFVVLVARPGAANRPCADARGLENITSRARFPSATAWSTNVQPIERDSRWCSRIMRSIRI